MSEPKDNPPANQPLALVVAERHSKFVTPVSLTLPDDLPREEWQELGQALGRAGTTMQWLIGDWYRFGRPHYGGGSIKQVEQWGLAAHTCQNYASVCEAFGKLSRRREDLSFGHHEVVAGLPPREADKLLDWCRTGPNERRSVAELREEVHRRKQAEALREAEKRTRLAAQAAPINLTVVTESQRPDLAVAAQPAQRPDPPPAALDNSPAGRPVAPALTALSLNQEPEEPPPLVLDHAGIASAALAALAFDAALAVVAGWLEQRTPEEQRAARDVLYPPIRRPRS